MTSLRLLNNGQWNKPPLLTAARRILIHGLGRRHPACALQNAATFLNGTSYDVDNINDSASSPIIRISNITDSSAPYLKTSEDLGSQFWIRRGDLLVSWSASFKSTLWAGPEGYLNQHIFKVVERAGFERSYIRHAIEASFDEMQEKVVGIGMMHLRRSDFLSHEIPAPPLATQQAVASFLDLVEHNHEGPKPSLPEELAVERRIVARIEELATLIEGARTLRQEATEEGEALCRAILTDDPQITPTPMRSLVRLRPPDVIVRPDDTYQFAGVYCFGRGIFRGRMVSGLEFAYPRLTRLRVDDFVYPKLMAWEGAFGTVPPECDGCVVSTEFPVFEVRAERVLPEVLDTFFRSPAVWPALSGASTGTNVRRRRLNPQDFLDYHFPLPSMTTQDRLRAVRKRIDSIKPLHIESAAQLDALLPGILDRAFKGEL